MTLRKLSLATIPFALAACVTTFSPSAFAADKKPRHDWPLYGGTAENTHSSESLPDQSKKCEEAQGRVDL